MPSRGAQTDPLPVPQLPLDGVAHPEQPREQGGQRTPVGVAAGVGLGGDVVGHRHPPRQLRLFGGDQPACHQVRGDRLGRRAHEPLGDLGARDLRDDPVAHVHPAVGGAAQPGGAVAHHVRGEVHERGGLHAPHPVPQQQLHALAFQGVLARAVDQVDRVRQGGDLRGEAGQRPVDPPGQQPGRPEGRQHPGPGQRDHQLLGGDAAGHRAGHVRVSDAVAGAEGGAAEPLGRQRPDGRHDPAAGAGRGVRGADALSGVDDVAGLFQGAEHPVDPGGIRVHGRGGGPGGGGGHWSSSADSSGTTSTAMSVSS
ncbi:hypothetical protein RKD39_000151 [Streptomyces albogriseolus]